MFSSAINCQDVYYLAITACILFSRCHLFWKVLAIFMISDLVFSETVGVVMPEMPIIGRSYERPVSESKTGFTA